VPPLEDIGGFIEDYEALDYGTCEKGDCYNGALPSGGAKPAFCDND